MTAGKGILQFMIIVFCTGHEFVALQGGAPRVSDPIIGTWKLSIAKSRLTPIPAYSSSQEIHGESRGQS